MLSAIRKITLVALFTSIPMYASVHLLFTEGWSSAKFEPELTLENVYKELLRHGVQEPEIVLRQAIAETQWLQCKSCSMKFNNLFGFLTKRGYMKFRHWTASVQYYKEWQSKLYKGGDYYKFLKRVGYATSPNYIRLLKQIDVPDFI